MNSIRHIVFWVITTILLTLIFGKSYKSYSESFYFISMLLPVVIATAYFFNYFLVPRYLLKKKFFKFSLYSVYLLIISLNLEMYVVTASFIILAEYNYDNMNPVTTDVFILSLTLYIIVLFQAFIRLVRFYYNNENSINQLTVALDRNAQQNILIKENRKNVQVPINEIAYVESLGDYVKIHCIDQQIITKEKIGHLENKLPDGFLRIHRSFIINKSRIKSFNKESIWIIDNQLPISRTYKNSVLSALNI